MFNAHLDKIVTTNDFRNYYCNKNASITLFGNVLGMKQSQEKTNKQMQFSLQR